MYGPRGLQGECGPFGAKGQSGKMGFAGTRGLKVIINFGLILCKYFILYLIIFTLTRELMVIMEFPVKMDYPAIPVTLF